MGTRRTPEKLVKSGEFGPTIWARETLDDAGTGLGFMQRLPVVIHERLGTWARQLRPRLAGWPIHWVETRAAADLEAALRLGPCPILVLDLADRPRDSLADLGRAILATPNVLALVLDPGARPGIPLLARELGATHVLSGSAPPPAVAALLARWLPLARRRGEVDGWTADPELDAPL